MVFSSNIFLFLFLPITWLGYQLIRKELRNAFLLLMSLLFYAWGEPRVVLIMIASILINYVGGLLIGVTQSAGKHVRRLTLAVFVVLNLGILFYYKYFDFAISTVNSLTGSAYALRNIALPIGISFFTFQGMSYVIDVFMGNAQVQKNPINIALYISLFPQLIAGPIVRYQDVNREIDTRVCTVEDTAEGIRRFAIGLVKKMLLANTLGQVSDKIFALPSTELGIAISWAGAICYSLQIYYDFSGYSDMAIGLGRMFGFHFLENFNYPYIARNITDFWRRWHISLSTWFRDYVYIPLGGNRRGNQFVNLFVVFLLTGLWHGAAWSFVLWGLWHGLFRLIELFITKRNKQLLQKIPAPIAWLATMLIVIVGWVLFKAEDLNLALGYLGAMFGIVPQVNAGFALSWFITPKVALVLALGILASIPWVPMLKKRLGDKANGAAITALSYVAAAVLLVIGIVLTVTSTYNPFIYFRF